MHHTVCKKPIRFVSTVPCIPFSSRNSTVFVQLKETRDHFHHGPCPHVVPHALASFTTHITCFDDHHAKGYEHNAFSQRQLFFMHCKMGASDDAMALFANIPRGHVLMWNAIIQSHSRKGLGKETLHFFNQMLQDGIMPNKVTFACILSACAALTNLSEGKRVHARIEHGKLSSNLIVRTSLVNMYGKCGSIEEALQTFKTLPERDVVSFNTMMTSFVEHDLDKEALQLFEQMQQEGVMPNRVTYVTVVEACAIHVMLAQGEQIHACIFSIEEHRGDVALGNALINMYGKCNNPKNAQTLFGQMPKRDVISWNTIMAIYDHQRNIEKVLELFHSMQKEGLMASECTYITLLSACMSHTAVDEGMRIHLCIVVGGLESDVVLSTALLNMYGRCGSVEDAKRVFVRIPEKNVVSWNAMIAVCTQHDHGNDAILFFHQMMEEGMQPDKVTFVNAVSACASVAALAEGKSISLLVYKHGMQTDHVLGTSLVNMYGKCGELEDARMIFGQISKHNAFSWNVMMTTYAHYGEGKGIFELFDQMHKEGIMPDKVTSIAFLSGCNHSGLVNEGLHFFASMHQIYGIVPNLAHYVCVIDLLGKAGQLEEAAGLMNGMPLQCDIVSTTALLSACKCNCTLAQEQRVAQAFNFDMEKGLLFM